MKYTATFADIKNTKYQITIITEYDDSQSKELLLSHNEPLIIRQESEDIFSPIKSMNATLKIVSNDYYFDMYASKAKDVTIDIKRLSDNQIIFEGYGTPVIYNQDWKYCEEIELEFISKLSVLKYYDYKPVDEINGESIVSLLQILNHLFKIAGINKYYITNSIGITSSITGKTFLDKFALIETNFFDNDDEHSPWKCNEVLEEILKYLGLSIVYRNNVPYIINYNELANNTGNTIVQTCYSINTNTATQETISNLLKYSINGDSYRSEGGVLELGEVYDKVSIECSTYEEDTILKDIWDNNDLIVRSGLTDDIYHYHLELAKGDKRYWCYAQYYDNPIAPSSAYTIQYNTIPQKTNEKKYFVDNEVLCWQTRQANFENDNSISEIPASLTWSDILVMNLGIPKSRLPIGDYANEYYKKWNLTTIQDAGYNFIKTDDFRELLAQVRTLPLMTFQASNQMQFSPSKGKRFLIISGKVKYNDGTMVDNPLTEKDTKHKHNSPNIQGAIGLRMRITIGNKVYYTTPIEYGSSAQGDCKECCYVPMDEDGWYDIGSSEIQSEVQRIPVGGQEINWYDWMDITRNYDFMDGIDATDGFAIPLPSKENLNGKLKIELFGAEIPFWEKSITRYGNYIFDYVPQSVLIKDLKVQVVTPFDWYNKPNEKDKDDIKYTVDIDLENVTEMDAMELKINTQVEDRNASYSSALMYNSKGETEYIKTMCDKTIKTQLQEYNLLQKLYDHYSTPKVKFNVSLPSNDIDALTIVNYPLMENKKFIVDGQEINLQQNITNLTLIEF